MTAKRKSKGGRPTKYQPRFVRDVEKLTLIGAIDEQLADFFGVTVQTIENWKKKYSGFLEAIKRGKAKVDDQMERSLFHRGRGYSHPSIKIFYDSKRKRVVKVPYTEQYPPDTAAAFIWLKNRRPEHWRDQIEHGLADPANTVKVIRDMVGALFAVAPTPSPGMAQ